MKRLYKMYNTKRGEYGKPFTVCDNHYEKWASSLPDHLIVQKVADKSLEPCQI